MGLILDVLKGKEAHEVFIDMENAKPTNKEMKIYEMITEVLKQGQDVQKMIEEYKGCTDLARKAMSSPTPDNERAAFEGLLGAVDTISAFFQYSKELEKSVPELLVTLASPSHDESKQTLADQQALAKALADVFDFVLRFDQTRMQRPTLANDFSYYRRLLPKFNKHPEVKVKDEEASGMSLFTAEHIPMMSCLGRAAAKALQKNEHVTAALSVMANSCMKMIKSKKFLKFETNLFCARAMTGAIILYDHTHPLGAFHKRTPIAMKACILLLKKEFPKETALLNAIHFSTKNFKSAPSNIQELFN
jgi:hypothetical protein